MNEVQENHARQALKDIWDAAKIKQGTDDLGRFAGELMAKISTILEFDFDERYPPKETQTISAHDVGELPEGIV